MVSETAHSANNPKPSVTGSSSWDLKFFAPTQVEISLPGTFAAVFAAGEPAETGPDASLQCVASPHRSHPSGD